jgi:hypothetical protein
VGQAVPWQIWTTRGSTVQWSTTAEASQLPSEQLQKRTNPRITSGEMSNRGVPIARGEPIKTGRRLWERRKQSKRTTPRAFPLIIFLCTCRVPDDWICLADTGKNPAAPVASHGPSEHHQGRSIVFASQRARDQCWVLDYPRGPRPSGRRLSIFGHAIHPRSWS